MVSGNGCERTAHSGGDSCPAPRLPAPAHGVARRRRRQPVVGGARRSRRGQRRQGAQGPQLPRHLRRARRRLRRRVPDLPVPPRARPRPRLAGRHRRRRQPRPGARRLRRLPRARLSRSPGSSTSTRPRSASKIGDVEVRPVTELAAIVRRGHVSIGVVATPAPAAQDAADRLVAAGVTSILNFAAVLLTVPSTVSVRKVDLAVELQILSYYEQRRVAAAAVATPTGPPRPRRVGWPHMSIVVIGVNHRTAPLAVLERLAIAPDDVAKSVAGLAQRDTIREVAVLSTCGRTEVYARRRAVPRRLRRRHRLPRRRSAACRSTSCTRTCSPCTTTPRRPTCSRSPPGSTRPCSARARSSARCARRGRSPSTAAASRSTLDLLFRHALRTGKRARTETAIGRGTASISHAAVELATDRLGTLAGRRVLVVGAGDMGAGVATSLRKAGADRHHGRQPHAPTAGRTLAAKVAGGVVGFDELGEALADSDVVVTCVAGTEGLITAETLASRQRRRRCSSSTSPCPATSTAPSPPRRRHRARPRRRQRLGRARAAPPAPPRPTGSATIVAEQLEHFLLDSTARQAAPLVARLHDRAEQIRSAEVQRFAVAARRARRRRSTTPSRR